jgi:hypothetical protein
LFKKIFLIFILFFIVGCKDDFTPYNVIMKKIEYNNEYSQKSISFVLQDYYNSVLNNIRTKCSDLNEIDDDYFKKSIVESSNKYCHNISLFKSDFVKIINKINKKKNFSLNINMINGYQEFLQKNFSSSDTKIFLKYNISLNDAIQLREIENKIYKLEQIYFINNIFDVNTISELDDSRVFLTDKKLIEFIRIGIIHYDDLDLLYDKHIKVDLLNYWLKNSYLNIDKIIDLVKKNIDISNLDNIKNFK